jgi:hypothetical protein
MLFAGGNQQQSEGEWKKSTIDVMTLRYSPPAIIFLSLAEPVMVYWRG